jgi:hypothetical protein
MIASTEASHKKLFQLAEKTVPEPQGSCTNKMLTLSLKNVCKETFLQVII